ncbi:NHLP leader peptide family RiPP precursor [Thermodesulfobacteriota bacterium]
MKKGIEERKEYAKIIAQARVDEEFKKRLLDDPATVLNENGIEIPEGMTAKVVQKKENEMHIPLPVKPANHTGSVEELAERTQAFSVTGVRFFGCAHVERICGALCTSER